MSTRNVQVGFEFEFLTYRDFQKTREYISKSFGYNDDWKIESEGLDKDRNNQIPTEVKTTIFKGKTYPRRVLQSFLKSMRWSCYTNESCGLHINISSYEYGWQWDFNRKKLIRECNQQFWLRYFKRSNNSNCYAQDLKNIDCSKFKAVSFSHLDRVEFRIIGGQDYQYKSVAILQAYDDFVDAFTNSLKKTQ